MIGGSTESVGGTSASCPVSIKRLDKLHYFLTSIQTFSAIVALLNDYRIANGKSSLGFLNPLLYSTGTAGLNDITVSLLENSSRHNVSNNPDRVEPTLDAAQMGSLPSQVGIL